MKNYLACILAVYSLTVFSQTHQTPDVRGKINYTNLSYKIINSVDQSYGYNIFSNDDLIIRQPHIPCLPGPIGFIKKSDAKKVALLVIKKIERGEFPPTITIRELQNLNIKIN